MKGDTRPVRVKALVIRDLIPVVSSMALHRGKKVSLVGLGRMGKIHARVLARLDSLNSIVDTRQEIAAESSKKYGVPCYISVLEMLEKEKPEGVVVAVPTKYHEQVMLEIMRSPHLPAVILLEKPVAETVESALRIKKAINGRVKIIIGHSEVYNPVVSKMISYVESKDIGEPRTIIFQRRSPVSESRLQSIGDIFEDLGVHDFNIMTKIIKGEVTVYCSGIKKNDYYNSASIIFTQETDGKVDLSCSMLLSREYAGKKRTIEIEGTQATMEVDLLAQIIDIRSLEEATGEEATIRIAFKHGLHLKVYGEPLQEELLNVIDCIEGRAEPLVTLDDGIDALKIARACRESMEKNIPVKLEL
ncbi:MAG: Gfo/Idh/MocA family protein [Candidatus Hodarchaeales archaeon]